MADTIKIGNLTIDSFKVGAADCSIYLGATKLYPQGEPPTPSGIPFDNTLVGQTIPTSFKILKSELDAVTSNEFGCLADDYMTQLTIVPGESNNRKYYLYNEDDGTVYGTVVEEGDYYVFSHNITEFPTIALVAAPNSPVNLIID